MELLAFQNLLKNTLRQMNSHRPKTTPTETGSIRISTDSKFLFKVHQQSIHPPSKSLAANGSATVGVGQTSRANYFAEL